MLVAAGLIAFPNACFECADEGPEVAQHDSLANLLKTFQLSPRYFEGCCCCGILRVGAPPPSVAPCRVHLSLHTGPRAPTLCSARALGERGASSAAVESMASAMSVAMSLMQVPLGIGGKCVNHRVRNLASKVRVSHQPRLRSAVYVVSVVLSLFLRFGADLRGTRTFAYTRL